MELARRAEDERQRKVAEHLDHERFVVEHAELLLKVVAVHGRTTCSDENFTNYTRGRCVRCALLHAKKYNDFPYWLRISLDPRET